MARAFLVVASALVGVLPTLADSSSTSDYVQDGLVAHWDAIDNTGSGHDGAATTWTDLKGGRQFTLSCATWGSNYVLFSGASGSGGSVANAADLLSFDGAVTARTVEVVCEYATHDYGMAGAFFVGTTASRIALGAKFDSYTDKAKQGLTVFQSDTPGYEVDLTAGPNTFSCGYVRMPDDEATRLSPDGLYVNGRSREEKETSTLPDTAGSDGRINLGRNNNNGNRFNGYVYSVRIYNRLLTPAEIAANQIVDSRRFSEMVNREFYVDAENGVDDDAHDGTEPAKAKKSLSEIFKIANQKNDVVWALPGTYASGEETAESVRSRCVIPSWVRLESTGGATVTVIKGAMTEGATYGVGEDSLRTVYMNRGSKLYGFTLTGGSAENNGALYINSQSVVKDCVITNNSSSKGTAIYAKDTSGTGRSVYNSLFLRCLVKDNPSGAAGHKVVEGVCYAFVNSVVSGTAGYLCGVANGRFIGSSLPLGVPHMTSGNADMYNCTYAMPKDGSDKTAWHGCLFAEQTAYDAYRTAGLADDDCAVGADPVDRGLQTVYEEGYRKWAGPYTCEIGKTLGGVPRVMNRRIDFGAEEFDWRPTYSRDLALQRVTVTTATPGVCETADKKVALADGDELVVDWTAPFAGENEYDMHAQVIGKGTLSVYLGDGPTPFATVSSADGETTVVKTVEGSPVFRFVFDGPGEARLWDFTDTTVVRVDIPQGGVKVTGVAIGEDVIVKPGEPVTIKLERTYDSSRLCTGFIVNDLTFVNFDDYPDGWSHTVSDRASAVTIVAQYKTVQDFYVDLVNGNDANCGFQTNRAWKTLATIATNANVRAGDVVYALPGRYQEGALRRADGDKVLNRVIVPAGVTLRAYSPNGTKDTFICGADAPEPNEKGLGEDATRCAFLEDGARLCGLTLTGGRTMSGSTETSDTRFAGFATEWSTGDDLCTVVDCVISNNTAPWRSVGGTACYVRCRITGNKAEQYNGGVQENSYLYNCFVKDGTGFFATTMKAVVNCTFLDNATLHHANQYASVYNSFIKAINNGCTLSNCVYGSCGAATVVLPPSRQVDFSTLEFDEDGRCLNEEFRDVGANASLDLIPEEFRGVDKDGIQRVYNGTVDIGAYEYDKRVDFASDLGRKFVVEQATPGTTEVGSSVRLADGDVVTLGWKPGRRPTPFVLPFEIDGGTLTVRVNGVEVATFTASGEWRSESPVAADKIELSFAASAADGAAVLKASVFESGLMLLFR